MTCELCPRDTIPEERLCRYHQTAKRNLTSNYKKWEESYGTLKWEEYCERIMSLHETGVWVKEVAAHLLKGGTRGETGWS